mgnify:CR=1 FL=1|tara:strand:+ start:1374 stop:1598 length:225 start_codon:yes stop_codon:yes gene_type:complete
MSNPFYLDWTKGWQFTLFLQGGMPLVEGKGYGIIVQTKIFKGESPKETADRLILKEEIRRKSISNSWKRSVYLS